MRPLFWKDWATSSPSLHRATEQAVAEDVLSAFSDAGKVSNFAKEAMNWAVANGLINGIGNGASATLSPTASASRAQFATILMRYMTEE